MSALCEALRFFENLCEIAITQSRAKGQKEVKWIFPDKE